MQPYAHAQAGIDILAEAEKIKLPVDRVMAHYFRSNRYIGGKDKKAISGLVYGVLRQQGLIDWALLQQELALTPRLRVAAWYALNDEDVHRIFNGEKFAPKKLSNPEKAVLQIPQNIKNAPQHAQYNYPAWVAEYLTEAFGKDLEDAMDAMNQQAEMDVRLNTLKTAAEKQEARLKEEGVEGESSPYSAYGLRLKNPGNVFGLKAFKEGVFEVQDAGSQVIAALCNPQPGQKVTDYCAGAGGKTLALAAAMDNKGVLTSGDIIPPKINELKKRLRRAGVDNVQTQVWPTEGKNTWLKRRKGSQDVVLLDVPCSGSGVWRRNPDAKWVLNQQRLDELCHIQKEILQQASALVKPGGRLVYATCSVFHCENEAQVNTFLEGQDGFKLVPVKDVWEEAVNAGHLKGACPSETDMLRLAPHTTNTDGFFVAVLEKI